jgi:predicted dehydrogenase
LNEGGGMRIGVAGCGYWGSKHVRVLQQLSEVDQVVIIDPQEERRTVLLQSFPSLRALKDLPSAIDDVDAVVIATPPSTHLELALQALEAGKHVLIEKPMTTDTASARRLIAEAEAASLVLMVGHTFEYNAAVWKLREVIKSGELGSVYYIDTARLNLGVYQNDINVIWDLAPHDISIINYLLGSTPAAVQAWGSSHVNTYLEDVAYMRLQYPHDGITAHIHVSWLDPCKVRRVTVVGSRKMAVYNDLADAERVRIYDKGVEVAGDEAPLHGLPMSYRYGGIFSPFISLREPLSIQDEHFVDCVLNGRPPLTDGNDGLAVVQVLEAAEFSLRHGVRVPLQAIASWSGKVGMAGLKTSDTPSPERRTEGPIAIDGDRSLTAGRSSRKSH